MPSSYVESLRKLTVDLSNGKEGAQRFRARAWLNYAVCRAGCPWAEFVKIYVYRHRARSGLAEKWRNERVLPTRHSARQIEKRLPGTLEVYDSPLFFLLEDRPFSVQDLQKLFEPYRASESWEGFIVWQFPTDDELMMRRRWVPTIHIRDTASLVRRGDIWGFIAALWLVRYSEATGDQALHLKSCKDMYRAIPAALKAPWLTHHADELFQLLETVRRRSFMSLCMFDVDFEIIKRQANDVNHEPQRELRPIDPETHRFMPIEDPVLDADVIPGKVVKDRQRKNEARRALRQLQRKPSKQ